MEVRSLRIWRMVFAEGEAVLLWDLEKMEYWAAAIDAAGKLVTTAPLPQFYLAGRNTFRFFCLAYPDGWAALN